MSRYNPDYVRWLETVIDYLVDALGPASDDVYANAKEAATDNTGWDPVNDSESA
jgi:hypothetical protein